MQSQLPKWCRAIIAQAIIDFFGASRCPKPGHYSDAQIDAISQAQAGVECIPVNNLDADDESEDNLLQLHSWIQSKLIADIRVKRDGTFFDDGDFQVVLPNEESYAFGIEVASEDDIVMIT